MKKQLIIGTATLAIVGSMLLGSTLYAASSNAPSHGTQHISHHSGHKHDQMQSILATLSADIQTQLKTIRTGYQAKEQALHASEKSEIDTILAKYPDVKTKLDSLKTEHKGGWEGSKNKDDSGKDGEDADDDMTPPPVATP